MDQSLAARRFRTARDLFEAGVEMMRQNLRRELPEADEKEIALRLTKWLQERPGAELGDCDGRPIPWPREYQPPLRRYHPTPAEKGSGFSDVSVNHDNYLALGDSDPTEWCLVNGQLQRRPRRG